MLVLVGEPTCPYCILRWEEFVVFLVGNPDSLSSYANVRMVREREKLRETGSRQRTLTWAHINVKTRQLIVVSGIKSPHVV